MTRRPSRKSRPSARKPSASTGMSTGVERPPMETDIERMKPLQYNVGQQVYTYQNPNTASPIVDVRVSKDATYDHAYKVRLPDGESKWINESSVKPQQSGRTVTPAERKRDPYLSADSKVYPEENRVPARTYNLDPQYDSRKSFYGKAKVTDSNGRRTLTSYNTDVAYIQDGKAFVNGTYSNTTLRHIKEFLKQNGFKAESKSQIESDY